MDLALSRERDAASYQDTLRRVYSESGRLRSIVEDLLWLARADADPSEGADRPGGRRGRGGGVVPVAVPGGGRRRLGHPDRPDRPAASTSIRADARLGRPVDQRAARQRLPVRRRRGHRATSGSPSRGGRVVLTVDDSGPGIPEAHRDLVFDRFHRADDSPGGTGLGLAIADAVVRNSGGTWAVGTSSVGRRPDGGVLAPGSAGGRPAGASARHLTPWSGKTSDQGLSSENLNVGVIETSATGRSLSV